MCNGVEILLTKLPLMGMNSMLYSLKTPYKLTLLNPMGLGLHDNVARSRRFGGFLSCLSTLLDDPQTIFLLEIKKHSQPYPTFYLFIYFYKT